MTELGTRTARDLAAMIRRREISSRELLDHFLGAIELQESKVPQARRDMHVRRLAGQARARDPVEGDVHGRDQHAEDAWLG